MSEPKSAAARWPAKSPGDGAPSQDDRTRPLTPAEREWKESIYERLLKVLDLSLLEERAYPLAQLNQALEDIQSQANGFTNFHIVHD